MLLRTREPLRFCNGPRLVVKKLLPHVIEATILAGCSMGQEIFIPGIPLTSSCTEIFFTLCRLQFTLRIRFAMSVNMANYMLVILERESK